MTDSKSCTLTAPRTSLTDDGDEMAKAVFFNTLVNGEPVRDGIILLTSAGKLAAAGDNDNLTRTLNEILSGPIPAGKGKFVTKDEPELFLENLHREYNGSYFWADPVEDVADAVAK